jgi:hypothetical protein
LLGALGLYIFFLEPWRTRRIENVIDDNQWTFSIFWFTGFILYNIYFLFLSQVSIIIGIFIIATSDLVNSITASANILAFFPLPIQSHFSGFNPLFLELANRGHRVTVVTPFYPKDDVPTTYRHVPIPDGMQ